MKTKLSASIRVGEKELAFLSETKAWGMQGKTGNFLSNYIGVDEIISLI